MGKLTLNKLKSVELSKKLVKTADAVKGGNMESCHSGDGGGDGGGSLSCMMLSCSDKGISN